jgi:hypothetical protein
MKHRIFENSLLSAKHLAGAIQPKPDVFDIALARTMSPESQAEFGRITARKQRVENSVMAAITIACVAVESMIVLKTR